ncbi:MAG: hypothetical protein M3Z25_15885 [Actinomycetota bacterium]|nr:hypothetical protein [Actinomycetota bacterium]
MGIHESTQRTAVADLVPTRLRGTGYGIFTTAYGIAWLTGSTIIGALYEYSLRAVVIFTVATQFAAVALFLPLITSRATTPDRAGQRTDR